MAENKTYKPIREGKELLFITNCNFCNAQIHVKRRNKKYCNKVCKELAYRERKYNSDEGTKGKDTNTEHKLITFNRKIRELLKSGNEFDKLQAKMLQDNRDKYLASMDIYNK